MLLTRNRRHVNFMDSSCVIKLLVYSLGFLKSLPNETRSREDFSTLA